MSTCAAAAHLAATSQRACSSSSCQPLEIPTEPGAVGAATWMSRSLDSPLPVASYVAHLHYLAAAASTCKSSVPIEFGKLVSPLLFNARPITTFSAQSLTWLSHLQPPMPRQDGWPPLLIGAPSSEHYYYSASAGRPNIIARSPARLS